MNIFYKALLWVILFLSTLACGPISIVRQTPAPSPTPLPTIEPTQTPTQIAPTATTNSVAESVFSDTAQISSIDFNLDLHKQAMLPEFSQDVDSVAASGAARYAIEVTLDPSSLGDEQGPTLTGKQAVLYTNTESVPLTEIYFRLYPNLPNYGGQMTIESVTIDQQNINSMLWSANSILAIPLTETLQPEASIEIILEFTAQVPTTAAGGYRIFAYRNNILALAGFHPVVAVYDHRGWNIDTPAPFGDSTYHDIALYQVQLTVPEDMVVAASGNTIDQISNPDGSKTLSFVSGPMRDFYIVMSPDYKVTSDTIYGIVVNSYYPADLELGGLRALGYVTEALHVFGDAFGQYPYAEFDIVATPTTAGGVEYPGIVVIAQTLYQEEGGFFEHATVHEVAHQWWYGVVGNDQIHDPWLDESLTNYSTIFYWEHTGDEALVEGVIEGYFRGPYERAVSRQSDRPVIGAVGDFTEEEYGIFVYGKGPLFFHELRNTIGDEAFLDLTRRYYDEYKYEIAQPQDLFQLITETSAEASELINIWLEN